MTRYTEEFRQADAILNGEEETDDDRDYAVMQTLMDCRDHWESHHSKHAAWISFGGAMISFSKGELRIEYLDE